MKKNTSIEYQELVKMVEDNVKPKPRKSREVSKDKFQSTETIFAEPVYNN